MNIVLTGGKVTTSCSVFTRVTLSLKAAMVDSGVVCLVSPSLVPPVLPRPSLCLSVSVSLPVSLNVCVCDVGVALLSFWWLPDCCWSSTPAPSLTPATHPLIHSAEYQPWSFSHSLPCGCSSRFSRTQALQIVVSSYSSCVYSPFTLFFLFFCFFFLCATASLLAWLAVHCPVYSSAIQLATSWCPRIPLCTAILHQQPVYLCLHLLNIPLTHLHSLSSANKPVLNHSCCVWVSHLGLPFADC